MNRMLQKQKDRAAMQKVLGKEDAEKPKPRTIRDRINDLQHKQYIKGAQIFATQYAALMVLSAAHFLYAANLL